MISIISDEGYAQPMSFVIDSYFADKSYADLIVSSQHDFDRKNMLRAAYYCKSISNLKTENKKYIIVSLISLSKSHNVPLLLLNNGNLLLLTLDTGLSSMVSFEGLTHIIGDSVANVSERLEQVDSFLQKAVYSNINYDDFEVYNSRKKIQFPPVKVDINKLLLNVIYINKDGDIITNLTQEVFEQYRKGRDFEITYNNDYNLKFMPNGYQPNDNLELLAYFNDFDFLVISSSNFSCNTKQLYGFHIYVEDSLINSKIIVSFL